MVSSSEKQIKIGCVQCHAEFSAEPTTANQIINTNIFYIQWTKTHIRNDNVGLLMQQSNSLDWLIIPKNKYWISKKFVVDFSHIKL